MKPTGRPNTPQPASCLFRLSQAARTGISLLLAENRLSAVSRPVKTRMMPMMSSLRSKDMPAGGKGCCALERARGAPPERPLAPPRVEPPLAGADLPPLFDPALALGLGFLLSCGLRKRLENTRAGPLRGIIARMVRGNMKLWTYFTAGDSASAT